MEKGGAGPGAGGGADRGNDAEDDDPTIYQPPPSVLMQGGDKPRTRFGGTGQVGQP